MNSLGEQVKSAQAQVEVARANAGSAAAVVKQRDAVLAQARVDLERTAIRSPVDGIVIKRSVDKGQTVAASLQAPELFIIAENLTDLRVDTSIDESEVGKIQLGQKATFTVDAFPGRTFEGQVKQIRKSAQVVSNVVTYLVAISTQNSDLKLLPGMTANVRVVTSVLDDVLKVPNSALRFRPPQKSDEKSDKKTERTKSGQKEGSANGSGRSKREPGVAKLYRVENNELKEITVKTGASDGKMTEITGEGVAEGVEVVTGVKGGDSGRGRSSSSSMGNAPRVF
jgi:HlyD family secretion protein